MDKKDYICIDIRCKKCNKKLAESKAYIFKELKIEIKCSKCGHINKI